MNNQSTIILDKEVINELKKTKEYERQTYNDLLKRMIKIFKEAKKRNQYDEFLHKIQQPKMNELWNNKEDEIWDAV